MDRRLVIGDPYRGLTKVGQMAPIDDKDAIAHSADKQSEQ
jgi:hypothetical protein